MKDDEEYLISYANFKSNLFPNQKNFLGPKELKKFYENVSYGFPICLPKKIKYFDYKNAKYFSIDKKKFGKKIFGTFNLNYVGLKKFFRYGSEFAYNVKLKKQFRKKFNYYYSKSEELKKNIKILKKKNKRICAMQIRNVPHYGHEAVFRHILLNFDCLFLNPIFGIKKKNDFSNLLISKALKFVKSKIKNIEFNPLWTNFHYAGPREAIHHLLIRQSLGFDYFYVGRDHAGAENLYNQDAAIKTVKRFKHKFKIKPFMSKGGFYCGNCNRYLIKDTCTHKELKNISGTEFRQWMNKKKIYRHADKNLQKILFKVQKK